MSALSLITAEQLYAQMQSGREAVILDVRNADDAAAWKIEGRRLTHIHIPYFDFLEEDEELFRALPRDKEIIVVCAKGNSAQFVAGLLEERGYMAAVLQGGMRGWSELHHTAVIAEDETMKLIQIVRPAKGCLSYAIVSEGKAMIVDASRRTGVYLQLAEASPFEIEHVADTHLHADHISGGRSLAEQTGAVYYISSGEADGTGLAFEPLEQHPVIRVGRARIEVLAIPTPGHTPGSTSFLLNGRYLLSGDTVFVSGLGRPDLGGKARQWADDLYETLIGQVNRLSDEVLVLPAHFAGIDEMREDGTVAAPLGQIREMNAMMHPNDRESFIEQAAGAVSTEKPPHFEEIVAINRGELQADDERAAELELGPNRCAVHHRH
ncbi:MBL fold metallo-hydrolase [Paenibacillus doosanensis]|uniref:MBL fold metallo-hydrolase n=1 Tax=Paenibacillus doosanensis TaxID=1229154 RepID=UPI0021801B49|nr:MBL fold metallo-hydrolase [Paenibacillus doosanensis]MCS7461727.1 MBL fold metallo-hydrolase [Paenibacillus doosanensis]